MGSIGGTGNRIVDYTIQKQYITSGRKARTSQVSYSIRSNGKTLHEGIAKVIFSTQKELEDFVQRYNSGQIDRERYRWV